jgi:hypothetical protein
MNSYADIFQQRQNIENEYRYKVQQLQQQEQALRQEQSFRSYQPYQQPVTPAVRPISGIEEVQNIPAIPFETLYFSDTKNGKIYTKQIGMDGNPVIETFVSEIIASPKKEKPKEDSTDKVLKALADIEKRLAAVEKKKPVVETIEKPEGKDDPSTADT